MRVESGDPRALVDGNYEALPFRTLVVRLDDGTIVGRVKVRENSEEERATLEAMLEAVHEEGRLRTQAVPIASVWSVPGCQRNVT